MFHVLLFFVGFYLYHSGFIAYFTSFLSRISFFVLFFSFAYLLHSHGPSVPFRPSFSHFFSIFLFKFLFASFLATHHSSTKKAFTHTKHCQPKQYTQNLIIPFIYRILYTNIQKVHILVTAFRKYERPL